MTFQPEEKKRRADRLLQQSLLRKILHEIEVDPKRREVFDRVYPGWEVLQEND